MILDFENRFLPNYLPLCVARVFRQSLTNFCNGQKRGEKKTRLVALQFSTREICPCITFQERFDCNQSAVSPIKLKHRVCYNAVNTIKQSKNEFRLRMIMFHDGHKVTVYNGQSGINRKETKRLSKNLKDLIKK